MVAVPAGYRPPLIRTAGWSFRYRVARLLGPLSLFHLSSPAELTRDGVIVLFADGNPPKPPGSKRPAYVVLGLWGGVLEGTNLHVTADPATDAIVGSLEF